MEATNRELRVFLSSTSPHPIRRIFLIREKN